MHFSFCNSYVFLFWFFLLFALFFKIKHLLRLHWTLWIDLSLIFLSFSWFSMVCQNYFSKNLIKYLFSHLFLILEDFFHVFCFVFFFIVANSCFMDWTYSSTEHIVLLIQFFSSFQGVKKCVWQLWVQHGAFHWVSFATDEQYQMPKLEAFVLLTRPGMQKF